MRRGILSLVAVVLLVSCSAGGRTELLVSAAASLTDAFAALEAAFEEEYPDVDVVLNLAGSAALREQILAGAPTAVFAAADETIMRDVASAGLLREPARVFATNRLAIAVPAGNPVGVVGLDDFARPELLLGLCATGVPCGDLARTALQRAGVAPAVDTDEPNVRALLTKIELGDLDAGIVYVTDVISRADHVDEVPISNEVNPVASYPVAVLADSDEQDLAVAFVSFVLSAEGQAILAEQGFGAP